MTNLDYDIIATLGPSSNTKIMWERMASAGVTGFRLNTSHLTHAQLSSWLEELNPFLESTGLALVLDLQGSKWRLGNFHPFELLKDQQVEFKLAEETELPNVLPVPHPDFFQAALLSISSLSSQSYTHLTLNDAKISLQINVANNETVKARVDQGGVISPRKGIVIMGSDFRIENVSGFDQSVIMATRNIPFVKYAISYIKDAVEMEKYRSVLGKSLFIIAKLERQSAINEAYKIAECANELWLCRGDLGAELAMSELARQVFQFSNHIPAIRVPVLMAGQMLEHMTEHVAPTRSEICYLFDTLRRGYKGVVLSDETAIGRYPLESCQTAALFKAGKS